MAATAPSVGARVNIVGRGVGVIALDNDDGTWNIMFDDDGEADFPTADIRIIDGNIGDMKIDPPGATALVIWLHGCTDTPDGWHRIFSHSLSNSYVRVVLPCAPVQWLSRAGKVTTSWYDLKTLPIRLTTVDPGTGQNESISKVHAMIDDAVASGIPSSRIVVGGHSQGDALALAATLQAKVPLAGCVVFSGWVLSAQNLSDSVKSAPAAVSGTQFLVTHGDQDSTVLPECGEGVVKLLAEGCSDESIRFKVVSGMGHCTRGLDSEEVSTVLEFLTSVLPPA